MWCKACQQDVPGILSDETGKYGCPRCTQVFSDDLPDVRTVLPDLNRTAEPVRVLVPPVLDDWELEDQLRQIGRVLLVETPETPIRESSRFDWAQPLGAPKGRRAAVRPRLRRLGQSVDAWHARWVLPVLTWLATLAGTMLTVCGGVLLLWSLATGRDELWRIGLPIGLGGAVFLAMGLLLQLDQLWKSRRIAGKPGQHRAADSCESPRADESFPSFFHDVMEPVDILPLARTTMAAARGS